MKIAFILPGFIKIQVGGVKVVNEYANRLSDRGHEVTLIYPLEIRTGNPIYFLRKKIPFSSTDFSMFPTICTTSRNRPLTLWSCGESHRNIFPSETR